MDLAIMSDATPPAADPAVFDPARMLRSMERFGHPGALGLRYADHGSRWIELSLPWREDLVGDVREGTIASGAVTALMDMAGGLSIWVTLGTFRPCATLDLRIDYLRPAVRGLTVTGRVECTRIARDVAFVRGLAHDGDADDAVAHMAGSFMFTGPAMPR